MCLAIPSKITGIDNNMATIEYDVGATTLLVESSPTGNSTVGSGNGSNTMFLVDRMVDLTVTRSGATYTNGTAGGTAVLTFTVANTGNDTFDFDLSGLDLGGVADPYGGTDNLDGITVAGVYVDSDGPGAVGTYTTGSHSYDASDTTNGTIDNLAQDQMINVYMVCNVPATAAQGDIAVMLLRATALDSGGGAMTQSAGADTAGMETVFADDDADGAGTQDAARNAQDVDTDAFQVQAPSLTVTKTSAVQADPVNGTSNPMAIPLARVRYTILIENNGSSDASGLVATDAIPGNTWFYVGSITGDTASHSSDGGTNYTYAPTAGTYGEDQSVTHIRADVGTVAAGGSATVTFDVIIQ